MARAVEGSWLTHLQDISPNLKVGVNESYKGGRTLLLALLGPSEAGPHDDDGWFVSDFAFAHLLYGGIVDEQCWLSSVDLLKETEANGPYLWGHPKNDRIVVFSKDDEKFYNVCNSKGLIVEFKNKLQEMVASMGVEDRLLFLIFAHGEDIGSTGILVGTDISSEYGILTTEEVNELLQPLSGGPPVTLITSACYSGMWDASTLIGPRGAASNFDEESYSFPISNSRGARGGYFWNVVWYELSRLGVWLASEEVSKDDTFREWSENVKQRVQDMFLFHLEPTSTLPHPHIWEKHPKEVLCYKTEGDNVSSSRDIVPPNANVDSVGNPDVHFTRDYMKVLAFPLAERLPTLMDYLSTCNLGLPNAANNVEVFRLAQLYKSGLASMDQVVKLDQLLSYRVLEDWRAERILNFLRIPRVCSISNFKQWKNKGSEISPYLHVVTSIMPFGDPPAKAYRYTKPVNYVAWTAYMAKVSVDWLKTNLCLYVHMCTSGVGFLDSGSIDVGETSGSTRESND